MQFTGIQLLKKRINWKERPKRIRLYAIITLIVFGADIICPSVIQALTSGPNQPEFSSFEPVVANNMVNEFTGDFSYNIPLVHIPGPNGTGYSMALSYHSGASLEDESSWVGYGWSLNPGAINRVKRGIADDWNGRNVTSYNKSPKNQTVTQGVTPGFEAYSFGLGINGNFKYNNYKGFTTQAGFNLAAGYGLVSLGYNMSTDAEGSFSFNINPMAIMNIMKKSAEPKQSEADNVGDQEPDKAGKTDLENTQDTDNKTVKESPNSMAQTGKRFLNKLRPGPIGLVGGKFGLLTYGQAVYPTTMHGYEGASNMFCAGIQANLSPAQLGINVNVFGSYSWQLNNKFENLNAYGQMYLTNPGQGVMLDYHTDKDGTFSKRDFFLPIPFHDKDVYNVSGEGVGGSFQVQHKRVGWYAPNSVSSTISNNNMGGELGIPLNWNLGANIGSGTHTFSSEPWQPTGFAGWGNVMGNELMANAASDQVHFRFTHDLGGRVQYNNENAQKAFVSGDQPNMSWIPNQLKNVEWNNVENAANRITRSGYIGFSTNEYIDNNDPGVYTRFAPGSPNSDINLERGSNKVRDQVGEFAIYNDDGDLYTYGLPVYSMGESMLSVGLSGTNAQVQNNYLAYFNGTDPTNVDNEDFIVFNGRKENDPYASAYLLTSITGADYIDINNNGPDELDFGNYTKFEYDRLYPGNINNAYDENSQSSWYKWRTPYRGMLYQRGRLSDPKDDMGTFNFGYKQIYYLQRVETKTHYAEFITSEREDGRDAVFSEVDAVQPSSTYGSHALKKLEEIKIYKKSTLPGTDDELIKRIRFEYSYELCGAVPNNINGGGKLTLQEVYVESGSVRNALIAPYKFDYNYPTSPNVVTYPDEYQEDLLLGDASTPAEIENPPYNAFNLDAWGNYQHDGEDRFLKMQTWINQQPPAYPEFDPAAWQLKRIELPSGGEIHVQYEQKDYLYVQDKRAHMMAPLATDPGDGGLLTIDAGSLGLNSDEIDELVDQINTLYVLGDERLYFKFLYKLIQDGGSTVDIGDCNAEFIDGYLKLFGVNRVGDEVNLLVNPGSHALPKDVCRDYVVKERSGMISDNANSNGMYCDFDDVYIQESSNVISMMEQVGAAFSDLNPGVSKCVLLNPEHSYLRIPVVTKKLGGGVRVKRLLTYDPGLSTDGVPVLYGDEYLYKMLNDDGKLVSSGVATNEPAGMREENILVSFITSFSQSWFNKVVAGEDKRQTEGPLFESVLPGPSIGYENVIKRSIHSGHSHAGYSESRYHTARTNPITIQRTGPTPSANNPFPIPLNLGVVSFYEFNLKATQGYAIYLNDMHGKLESSITYHVIDDGLEEFLYNPGQRVILNSVSNEYYAPGAEVPVVYEASIENEDFFTHGMARLGREVSITAESKSLVDDMDMGTGEFDFGPAPPLWFIPMIGLFPSLSKSNSAVRTNVVTKVISNPAILRKTVTFSEGAYSVQTFERFNAYNGNPVVTRSNDGFRKHQVSNLSQLLSMIESENHEGLYKDYQIPSHFAYENLNQVALNEGLIINSTSSVTIWFGKTGVVPELYLEFEATPADAACGLLSNFIEGDKIAIPSLTGFGGDLIYHIKAIHSNRLWLERTQMNPGTPNFGEGDEITIGQIRILRSGRNNRLSDINFAFKTYPKVAEGIELFAPPSEDLQELEAFVDQLNLLASGVVNELTYPGTLTSLPDGLGFYNHETGECNIIGEDDSFMLSIDEGQLNLYMTDLTPTNSYNALNQHPMVVALNNYLSDYQYFSLGNAQLNSTNIAWSCPIGGSMEILGVINNPAIYGPMIADQLTDLNQSFSGVFGENHSIADFFADVSHTTGSWEGLFNQTTGEFQNLRVVLEEIESGVGFGVGASCSGGRHFCVIHCGQTHGGARSTDQSCWDFSYQNAENHISFHNDDNGNLFLTYVVQEDGEWVSKNCKTGVKFYDYGHVIVSRECEIPLPLSAEFQLNTTTGLIEIYDSNAPCTPFPIDCIQFCNIKFPALWVQNVVNCSSTSYSDKWSDLSITSDQNLANHGLFETGRRGKWRTAGNYMFESEIAGLDSDVAGLALGEVTPDGTGKGMRNYNTGMYDMPVFNYVNEQGNHPKWLQLSRVTKYNQDGQALEERNIMGIKSAALFGYDQSLPYLVAGNSSYDALKFESFEKVYASNELENNLVVPAGALVTDEGHSGVGSLNISSLNEPFVLNTVSNFFSHYPEGIKAKFWFKSSHTSQVTGFVRLSINGNGQPFSLEKTFNVIGRSGEWFLAECVIDFNELQHYLGSSAEQVTIDLRYDQPAFITNMVIDDLLLQPTFASVQTYVYDVNNLQLMAQLDDQHYQLLYQYNPNNQLVRKMKETERGIKTLKESHYNTPLENKTY